MLYVHCSILSFMLCSDSSEIWHYNVAYSTCGTGMQQSVDDFTCIFLEYIKKSDSNPVIKHSNDVFRLELARFIFLNKSISLAIVFVVCLAGMSRPHYLPCSDMNFLNTSCRYPTMGVPSLQISVLQQQQFIAPLTCKKHSLQLVSQRNQNSVNKPSGYIVIVFTTKLAKSNFHLCHHCF